MSAITTGNTGGDAVNHPKHYNAHPSGVECIVLAEQMNFNVGNAFKYVYRHAEKAKAVEDLEKAAWYTRREIDRLESVHRVMLENFHDAKVYGDLVVRVVQAEPSHNLAQILRLLAMAQLSPDPVGALTEVARRLDGEIIQHKEAA